MKKKPNPTLIVPSSNEMPLSGLLEFFLDHRQHIALVVDEYGGTKGLGGNGNGVGPK